MTTTTKKAKRIRETREYAQAARRFLAGWVKRVGGNGDTGDIAELRNLADFATEAELALGAAVAGLRSEAGGSYSWAQIGAELGITRASAQQRFGKYCTESGRKVGGQPTHLR